MPITSRATVESFLAQPALALVGMSRSGKKFGNVAYRELTAKGYRVYPIHPAADSIDGVRCYHKAHRWVWRLLGRLPKEMS